ncbi:MAG: hypothetical protein U0176_17650 [Bacteroidia bacterium]
MAQVFRDGLANYVDRQGRLLFQEWFPIVRQAPILICLCIGLGIKAVD